MKKVMKNTPVQVLLDKIGIQKAGGEGPTPTPEVIASSVGVKIKQGNLALGYSSYFDSWLTTYRKNDGKVYQINGFEESVESYLDPNQDEWIYEGFPFLPRDLGGLWVDCEVNGERWVHTTLSGDDAMDAFENDRVRFLNSCDKVYDHEDDALYDIVDAMPAYRALGVMNGHWHAVATGESFTWEGEEYKVMLAHNEENGNTALIYGKITEVDSEYYFHTYYMKDGEFVPLCVGTYPFWVNKCWSTDGVLDEYISYWERDVNMGNVIPCPNATPENPSYGYKMNYDVCAEPWYSPVDLTLETRSAIIGGTVNLYGWPIGVIDTVEGAQGDADANAGGDTATGPIVVQISVDGKEWTVIPKALEDDTNVITNIPRGLFLKFSEDVNITEG